MFSGLRSDSTALMALHLPGGRFQSDGGLRIAAAATYSDIIVLQPQNDERNHRLRDVSSSRV